MLRSLNSGVTGLMNHQVRMDVIGNNIANVNTIGYKGRRVTFEESFNQLVKGASRTESKAGGTNPMQVGLGVAVGSVDIMTGQGQLNNTGRLFDLAIEGNAFFGVSDGTGTFYTRNGAFQLDSNGYIMLPTNGMVLQGKMADSYGNFPPGTAIGNLQIPMTQQAPAKETTEISLGKNLNSDADAKGSISYTQQFLHTADGARPVGDHGPNDSGREETLLSSLHDSNGNSLGMKSGDFLTISWYSTANTEDKSAANLHELRVKVVGQESEVNAADPFSATNNQVRNLQQLVEAIQVAVNSTGADYTVSLVNGKITIDGTGAGNPVDLFHLQIASGNPINESASYVAKALSFGSYIGPGVGNNQARLEPTSDLLLRPAEQYDYIENLTNNKGEYFSEGMEAGDTIDVFGSVGKDSIEGDNKSRPLTYWTGAAIAGDTSGTAPPYPTMLDDLMNKIRNDFRLPADYVDKDNNHIPSVYMDTAETEDGIPPGAIVICGARGEAFQINNLQIQAENADRDEKAPLLFNAATRISVERKASNAAHIPVQIPVYDSSGAEHTLTITFVHTGRAGEWEWKASFGEREEFTPATSGTGKLFFGPDGAVSSWLFDSGGAELIVDPRNGANQMRIRLDVGGPGNFKGITQWEGNGTSTINCIGQDGYGTGVLTELTIDEFGLMEGSFSNGTSRAIAQLLVVDFANPGGLLDLSDSVYTVSANSGDPVWGTPKKQSSSGIKPGALEVSNVDLSAEFTNMITTQRGYQANSRIITVSDTMLEELVNLKR